MHNLESNPLTGEYAMVAARRIPWHRLGDFEADRLLSLDEAAERAHLTNWQVRPSPLYRRLESGVYVEIDDKVAAIRTNPWGADAAEANDGTDYLGTVGSGIAQFQNEQLMEFVGALIDAVGTDQCVSAAGSIAGGRRVFVSLELPEEMTVAGVPHRTFLAGLTSHDGSMSLTTAATETNVVCQNTFDAVVRGQDPKHKVRHRGNMAAKVQEAREHIGLVWKWAEAYKAEMEALATQTMTDKAFEKIIAGAGWAPKVEKDDTPRVANRKERDREVLTYLFRKSDTTEPYRGTKAAGLMAITEWAEWGRPGDLSTERAAVSNLFGTTAQIRQKAVKILAA